MMCAYPCVLYLQHDGGDGDVEGPTDDRNGHPRRQVVEQAGLGLTQSDQNTHNYIYDCLHMPNLNWGRVKLLGSQCLEI